MTARVAPSALDACGACGWPLRRVARDPTVRCANPACPALLALVLPLS